MALELTSNAFKHEQDIPTQYTCEGPDKSPDLSWKDVPAGTKSFVMIMDDPDAPVGLWVHWVLYDIPASETGFAPGVARSETLPNGAKQGITSFQSVGYGGPCPPPGPKHRYFFKLYALDIALNLPSGQTKVQVEAAMSDHILAETQLMGRYNR